MEKEIKSARINFDKSEREILNDLKKLFGVNTRNAVIRKLIQLAKIKYL